MIKLTAALVILIAAGGAAQAMEVFNAGSMSCSRLQAAVQSAGRAVVKSTSTRVQGLPLTGTYVANAGHCRVGEITAGRSVRTADSSSCILQQCERRTRGTR